MPFTFSHPAAILPIYRTSKQNEILYPLVFGSVMPDFGYYFSPTSYFEVTAHTFVRSFTFCLPVGFLCLIIIYVLRTGWIQLIPSSKGQAFAEYFLPEKYNFPLIIKSMIAIVIGAWTHILWDSFTHKTGFMLNYLPFLNYEVFPKVQVFRILQHLSSLLGAIWLIKFYREFNFQENERRNFTRVYYFWFTANALSLYYAFRFSKLQYFHFITSFISCFIMIMLIRSILNVIKDKLSS